MSRKPTCEAHHGVKDSMMVDVDNEKSTVPFVNENGEYAFSTCGNRYASLLEVGGIVIYICFDKNNFNNVEESLIISRRQ